jgi:hypothetical protein
VRLLNGGCLDVPYYHCQWAECQPRAGTSRLPSGKKCHPRLNG